MESKKREYIKGLICFIFAVVLFISVLTLPCGRSFFHVFLEGVFGSPVIIPGAVIYTMVLCAVIAAILTGVFWRKYFVSFGNLVKLHFILPAVIVLLVAVLGVSNLMYPVFTPIIDRVYFSVKANRTGLHAVTFTWNDYSSRITGGPTFGTITETMYDFTFHNHGASAVEFHVQPMEMTLPFRGTLPRQLISYTGGEKLVLFTIDAQSYMRFSDEIIINFDTRVAEYFDEYINANYRYLYLSLICETDSSRHEVLPLVRQPSFSR